MLLNQLAKSVASTIGTSQQITEIPLAFNIAKSCPSAEKPSRIPA
jgi:hypothetical protein